MATFQHEDGRIEKIDWLDTDKFAGEMGVTKNIRVQEERHLERIWKDGDLFPSQIKDRGVHELQLTVEYPSRVVEAPQLSLATPQKQSSGRAVG